MLNKNLDVDYQILIWKLLLSVILVSNYKFIFKNFIYWLSWCQITYLYLKSSLIDCFDVKLQSFIWKVPFLVILVSNYKIIFEKLFFWLNLCQITNLYLKSFFYELRFLLVRHQFYTLFLLYKICFQFKLIVIIFETNSSAKLNRIFWSDW